MNQSDIKKYYKIFGIFNLILSVLCAFFASEIELSERITAVLAINGIYHVPYLFFSSISKDSTRMNNNFNKIVGGAMLKLFSIFGMIGSFILMYVCTSEAISLGEYYSLVGITILFGPLLGSYSLWIDLKNE